MARFNFCGPSYTSQSPNADDERLGNAYVEVIEGSGKSQYALYPSAGLAFPAITLLGTQIAVMIQAPDNVGNRLRTFAIAGGGLYEVGASLGATSVLLHGTFSVAATIPETASITYGQSSGGTNSLFMAVAGNTYVFNMGSNAFSTVTTPISGSVSIVGYCDGFFLAVQQRSSRIYASDPLDPTTWNALSTAIISVFPDNIADMVVNQRLITFLGQTASVTYYDSGNSPFPFDVVQGSYMEIGAVQGINWRGATAVKLDNSYLWLGYNHNGSGIVWRANGYTPQRVSNHAVEFAIQSYAAKGDISNAVAYGFQDQGHTFYQINFPDANDGRGATWVYDVATGFWHERFFLDPVDGKEYMHRSQCHALAQSNSSSPVIHVVGDWQTGTIYQMQIPTFNDDPTTGATSWNFADDFGNPLQRVRRAPYISTEKEWIVHREFQLDMETGIGPIPGFPSPSSDPEFIYLQTPLGVMKQIYVDDGGNLHSNTSGVPANAVVSIVVINYDALTFQLKLGDEVSLPQWFQIPTAYSLPGSYPLATNPSKLQTSLYNLGGGGGGGGHAVGVTPPLQDYRGPEVILRWSDDSGHLWKYNLYQDTGATGAYNYRPRFSRLGRSRQRIYEVKWTDAVPFRIVDAYVKADQDYTPQKRLVKKLAETA